MVKFVAFADKVLFKLSSWYTLYSVSLFALSVQDNVKEFSLKDVVERLDGDEGVEHPQVGCLADRAYAESQLDAKRQRRLGVVNAHA